jgi:nitroreductase
MELIEAIQQRRSIRSFKPDPVPGGTLEQLLLTSRWSPSGSNTQPWEFLVLGGKVLEEVKERLVKEMQPGPGKTPVAAHPDIPYPPMPEPFVSRQRALGKQMQAYLSLPESYRPDAARRDPRTSAGRFFGAPNALIVYVDREISPRSFLGLGMIAQTIALAALDYGLGTCIMSMVTYWPEIYREMFHIPDSKLIAFGIAIGYPNMDDRINTFPRTRENLETFTRWHGV